MNNEIKVLYCGECPLFLNECTDGSGQCKITKETCSCGDSCELEFLNKQLLAEQAKNKKLIEALEKIAEINKPTKLLGIFKADFWDMEQELTYVIAKQALKAKE